MDETIIKSPQLSIQQLSERLNVPKPTLRFWEKELEGIIVPLRTPGGQRRYTSAHMAVLEEIKGLRNSGKSLSEIKAYFNNGNSSREFANNDAAIDLLTERISELVKIELTKFLGME